MKSGSWASYQSALPVEARAGGEPDTEEGTKMLTENERRLRDALDSVQARAQAALDGSGSRAWSAEYVLEIVREIRDKSVAALAETEQE